MHWSPTSATSSDATTSRTASRSSTPASANAADAAARISPRRLCRSSVRFAATRLSWAWCSSVRSVITRQTAGVSSRCSGLAAT